MEILEIWENIVGYEKIYQVSNYGRVKSLSRLINRKSGFYVSKEMILKPQIVNGGYLVVRLKDDKGIRRTKTIHGLVANAFIPNPLNKREVNHKDLKKENNFVDNLEWMTRSENMKHASDNGVVNLENLKNKHVKIFSDSEVEDILQRKNNGEKRSKVYEHYRDKVTIGHFKGLWYKKTYIKGE